MKQGKVKIKEMGLREGHPEKEGVLVDLVNVAAEVKQRLKRKADLDSLVQEADGLKVVGGIKGEAEKAAAAPAPEAMPAAPKAVKPVEEQIPAETTVPVQDAAVSVTETAADAPAS